MPRQPFAKFCLSAFAVIAVVALIATPTQADEAKTTFSIPAQDLSTALREFARQSNREILFSSEVAQGKKSKGVKGDLTADAALIKLLAGTGLVVAKSANGTTLVTTPDAKEASGKSGPPNAPSGATTNPHQNSPGNEAGPVRTVQLEEVVVTGSRIPLAAGQQQVQPVRSYTREEIANSGQSTIGDFLNTLPDVSNFSPSSFAFGIAGLQTVQLHGLPIGTTLSLLDGRRVETGFDGVFDLSSIPVSAVERVEILPVGASAIYGADALGGAVNFILRKNFTGFEVNASLDTAPGVDNPGLNFAWGKSWERGSVSIIGSYQEYGHLLGTQREPTSSLGRPAALPVGSFLASDICAPGSVYSVDGSNLPGLSSPSAGIPAGVSGMPTIGQFATTAGRPNLCNSGRYIDITPQSQREGALLSAHYEFTETADVFTEILLSHRRLNNQSAPFIYASQDTLSANNPYNPFGTDVNVSFNDPSLEASEIQSASLFRPILGIRGSVFSTWRYEATATFSRDSLHDVSTQGDAQSIANALQSSNPSTALNPFTSGAPGSPALLSELTGPAADIFNTQLDAQIVSAEVVLRGPIVNLPAGSVQTAIGSDWSHEKQDDLFTSPASFGTPLSTYSLRRTTYSVFGEARVPILAVDKHTERLTLSIAGRYDHSDDFGGKATGQSGLSWAATDTLSLNGSYGTSYRAPRLTEISGPQSASTFPLFVSDPFRGNELVTYPVLVVSGPNTKLKPETGNSASLGLNYVSTAIRGLRASVTWYDVAISNYIGTPFPQAVVNNPALFPGAVVRAPPTLQDQQQGFLGVISQFNNVTQNFGDLHIKGLDADISYVIDSRFGQVTPSLAIANIYKWTSAIVPGAPAIAVVSQASFAAAGWAPRWKGTAAVAWKRDAISVNLAGRYIGRYRDYQDFVPNTNEIGNTWIVDGSARYDIGQAFTQSDPRRMHAYVSVSVVNLFNKAPPFAFTPSWYDQSEYDIRGRFLHLSVGLRY